MTRGLIDPAERFREQLPAIHLGGGRDIPGQRVHDLRAAPSERGTLARMAERLIEEPERFRVDAEERAAVIAVVEFAQLVMRSADE